VVGIDGVGQVRCQPAWQLLSTGSPLITSAIAASCKAHKAAGQSVSGLYWIDPNGGDPADAFRVFCDMVTSSGGWTLVLQASSISAFNYDHAIWTASSAPLSNTADPVFDQDMVSESFYSVTGSESMLCMSDLGHCNAWNHASNTAAALATGPRMSATQAGGSICYAFKCASNTFPFDIRWHLPASSSSTWMRWGYVNDNNAWGLNLRVGYTGDGDASDSSDTAFGIGLRCTGNCLTESVTGDPHGRGAGFYKGMWWSTVPHDGATQAFLLIR